MMLIVKQLGLLIFGANNKNPPRIILGGFIIWISIYYFLIEIFLCIGMNLQKDDREALLLLADVSCTGNAPVQVPFI